jgi:hypothetical protein
MVEAIMLDKSGKRSFLLDVLAAIVHPNMVIEYALVAGLTDQESAAVYRFIQPRITARFCA